jgi:hypothetical protein
MSALGQKRTLRRIRPMSALHPKADIADVEEHVRFVPIPDIIALLDQRERAAMEARLDRVLWRS